MIKETFEDFKERIGFELDSADKNLNLSVLIYFSSIYCHEKKLSSRRQITIIKKILNEVNNK